MSTPLRATSLLATLLATLVVGTGAQAQWRQRRGVVPPPPGTGRLRNAAQGLCLDVDGWAARKSSNVLLWDCNEDPDQVWTFAPTGELRNTLNGTCLDAAGYDGVQGANVDIYRCESLDDQRWTLIPRGHGTFELHNNKRGLCLDVSGRAGARGDNVLLWACDGGADQLWSFESHPPAPPPPRPVRPSQPPEPPELREMPVPPPPPPAPQPPPPRAMEEGSFRALVAAVRNEGFSERQVAIVQQAATRNFFRVGQLKALIELVSFSATKLSVLEIGAPRLVDPENAFALYDAFTFSADKEKAQEILRRNGI
ncbi:MAG TPA: RICIN domain-containing protein [Polyangia bacterium]|nr:RICIN domain-containing protein [Polyangia bacterium]